MVKKSIDSEEIAEAVERIADAIVSTHSKTENLVLAAIANGGVQLCSLLEKSVSKKLGKSIPKAIIDISFHRDDIGHKPITKEVQATHMATDPEDSVVILIDDVFFTGRTIRAAIAELLTIGRPYKVELAVLVDRGNRRLPFAANYVGIEIETTPEEKVEVILDSEDLGNSRIDILQH